MKSLIDSIENGKSPFERRFITVEELAALLLRSRDPLIVYGAGATSHDTLKCLFDAQILPHCLTDSDPNKVNTSILNLPVLSPQNALKKAGENAVCVVAIWSIATFYKDFLLQLEQIGYRKVFFLNVSFRPRVLDYNWVSDVQQHKQLIYQASELFADQKSKNRFEDFIHSFLSSKVDHCNVMGQYRSLDGEVWNNELVTLTAEDVIVHCRHGFHNDADNYLKSLCSAKHSYLFEPTWVGRIKTKECIYENKWDNFLVFPYNLGQESIETEFDQKIYFTSYIDQEEYHPTVANLIRLDDLADEIQPTLVYFDMTDGHLEALNGARNIIEKYRPTIILTGFRLASEAVRLMNEFSHTSIYLRYFGGITMREGYSLIIKNGTGS